MRLRKALQRAIAVTAAVVVLVQSTACSFVPARPDERTCEREKSEILATATDQAGAQNAIFFNATIDGRWSCAVAVPKDVYEVQLFATGSSGKTERLYTASLSVEPGRHYSVLAYETGVGQVPATAVLFAKQTPEDGVTPRSRSGRSAFGEIFGKLGALIVAPFMIAALIVVLPIAAVSKASKSGQEKAAMDAVCCFVWIEDGRTREVIVGNAPANR